MTALAALAHLVPGQDGRADRAGRHVPPSGDARQGGPDARPPDRRAVRPRARAPAGTSGSTRRFGIELPPIGERFDRLEAQVRVIGALFSEAARRPARRRRSMRRRTGSTARRMEPAPIRPGGPPIWLGGQGPRGLRMAARYADGWNYASNLDGTTDGFVERRDVLLRECEAIGRDPAELELSVQVIIPPRCRRAAPRGHRAQRSRYGRAGARADPADHARRARAPRGSAASRPRSPRRSRDAFG